MGHSSKRLIDSNIIVGLTSRTLRNALILSLPGNSLLFLLHTKLSHLIIGEVRKGNQSALNE